MSGAGGREQKNARDGDSGISAGAVGPQGSIINDRLLLKRRMHATGRSLTIPDRTSPKDCQPVFCKVPGMHTVGDVKPPILRPI